MPNVLWKRPDTLDAVGLDDNGLIGDGRSPQAVYQGAVLNHECLVFLATHIDLLGTHTVSAYRAEVSDGVSSPMSWTAMVKVPIVGSPLQAVKPDAGSTIATQAAAGVGYHLIRRWLATSSRGHTGSQWIWWAGGRLPCRAISRWHMGRTWQEWEEECNSDSLRCHRAGGWRHG